MKNYFKFRLKSYLYIFLGFLGGAIIASLFFEKPDYITGTIAILVGFLIGESIILKRWLTERRA